jgi:hypothetical protein
VVNDIDHDRRRFLRTAAIAMAGAQLGMIGSAQARGTNISFGPLKQIDAGLLSVAYAEAGAANGRPVILLHGRPYDIHSYVDVAPVLASAGYRVIVPYLRGYGATRFLSSETVRRSSRCRRSPLRAISTARTQTGEPTPSSSRANTRIGS